MQQLCKLAVMLSISGLPGLAAADAGFAIPEPSMLGLLAAGGVVGLLVVKWRR